MITLSTTTIEALFRGFTVFSTIMSAFVVLSGILFPSLMLNKTRPFSHMILCISFCDMINSIAYTFGFPADGSNLCTTQGILIRIFSPSAWLWNAVLVYQLRSIIIFKKIWLTIEMMHVIVWSIAICLMLLPLSTNTYGTDDLLNGVDPCGLGGDPITSGYWTLSCFFGVLFICFVLMIYWIITVKIYLHRQTDKQNKKELALYNATILYPICIFITWIPLFINYIVIFFTRNVALVAEIFLLVATQYSSLLTIIFIFNSKRLRYEWKKLLNCPTLSLKRQESNDYHDDSIDKVDESSYDEEDDAFRHSYADAMGVYHLSMDNTNPRKSEIEFNSGRISSINDFGQTSNNPIVSNSYIHDTP